MHRESHTMRKATTGQSRRGTRAVRAPRTADGLRSWRAPKSSDGGDGRRSGDGEGRRQSSRGDGGKAQGAKGAGAKTAGRPKPETTDRQSAQHRHVRPDNERAGARPPRRAPRVRDDAGAPSEPMRIAKAMARAGLCSRRDGERWIAEGRVVVNGKKLETAAHNVGPGDRVLVDGKPLPMAEPMRLWRYYKPKGLVTTHRDPQGRPTVFDSLPEDLPRVVSVGRLDFNTEGLLLLTTDGELARHLELPSTGWLRRYRVRAHGRIAQAQLDGLKDGVEIDGIRYGPVEATLDSTQGSNVWLSVALREGKNREVRKILESLELTVNRLIRVSFGPFQLLDMKPGTVEPVRRRVLIDQLGTKLAEKFGLTTDEAEDGDRPRRPPRPPGTKRPPRKKDRDS